MGEIADMMINGAMCPTCGEVLGNEVGYPQYCHSCKTGQSIPLDISNTKKVKLVSTKISCPFCSKKVKISGIAMHVEQVHQTQSSSKDFDL